MSPWRTLTAAAAAAAIAGASLIPYTTSSYLDVESMGSHSEGGTWCLDRHGHVVGNGHGAHGNGNGYGHDCDHETGGSSSNQTGTVDEPVTDLPEPPVVDDAPESEDGGESEVDPVETNPEPEPEPEPPAEEDVSTEPEPQPEPSPEATPSAEPEPVPSPDGNGQGPGPTQP
jgi:hypothetical protein